MTNDKVKEILHKKIARLGNEIYELSQEVNHRSIKKRKDYLLWKHKEINFRKGKIKAYEYTLSILGRE